MAAPMGRCARRIFCKNRCISHVRSHGSPVLGAIHSQQYSQLSEDIAVPQRKHRSDTAILEALASTVKKDYSGPHYKYVDDPALIPHSALEKRSYALSRASGQKAAQYVLKNYTKYFTNDIAEPSIEAYLPPRAAVREANTEAGILERIELRRPVDAYDAYQQACQAGVEVSPATLGRLMELLCAYNSQDPPTHLQPDEQFYFMEDGADFEKKIAKTWQDSGFAERLFDSMENKDASCYNALIRGRVKFYDSHRAYELYQDAREKKIPLQASTYTSILSVASFLQERADGVWDLVQDVLGAMATDGVAPTVHTFNNALYSLSRKRRHPQAPSWAMQLINEMKVCGIEPSLGSWYYVLQISYWHEDVSGDLMTQIVDSLQGKTFTYQDPADLNFFSFVMARCYYQLKDLELATKIDALVNHGNNIRLLGHNFREGTYYGCFLRLMCMFEQIDTIMEHYRRITPYAYTPTLAALEDLLVALDLNEGYRYLPQIWSDLVLYDQTRNVKFVELVLNLLAKKKQDEQLQGHFQTIAEAVLDKVQEDSRNSRLMKPLVMTGPMVGDLIQISLHSGNTDTAWSTFYLYYTKRFQIDGFPSETSLNELSRSLIANKETDKLINVLDVMSDLCHVQVPALVEEAKNSLELTDIQKNHLDDL